jgi:hypothetical protein
MAVIVTNKKGGKVVVRGTANTTLALSDLRKDVGETVTSATLTQIWVASEGASGGLVYYRANTTDANNICYRSVSGDSSYLDLAGNGLKFDEDKKTTQIIFVVPNGTTTFVAEFHKNSTFTSEY